MTVVFEMKSVGQNLVLEYIPRLSLIPIKIGIRWEPTWKAVPNGLIPKDALPELYWKKALKSTFLALPFELSAYGSMLQLEHALGQFFSSGILW